MVNIFSFSMIEKMTQLTDTQSNDDTEICICTHNEAVNQETMIYMYIGE